MKIVMVAAENGAIPGGKVGGMGDVIRDIPHALARLGHHVDVIVPGYQAFSRLPGSEKIATVDVRFRRASHQVEIFRLNIGSVSSAVRCLVIDHPFLAPQAAGEVYCNDPPARPFATDASKFAFFCAAVCALLSENIVGDFDAIHLHDWHTALVAVLARFDPRYAALNRKPLVYTIHNLALQGIRPFAGDDSALEQWFPQLQYTKGEIVDPRFPECLNPMRAAINLCHKVHAVSPTYALEIQRASQPDQGFFGGEGLEGDLQRAQRQGRLVGILNGCEYPERDKGKKGSFGSFLKLLDKQVLQWSASTPEVSSCHFVAARRIGELIKRRKRPDTLLTSVGRLTAQKVLLFQAKMHNGKTCIENILDMLKPNDFFILLGSGDEEIEQFFTVIAGKYDNFLFVRGYSEAVSDQLYGQGDLFLMPSSFEPCGISQMLAMRAGQPCLAHGVGGLFDTIEDGVDGFLFGGESIAQQTAAFVTKFAEVLSLKRGSPEKWTAISKTAAAKRFLWQDSAEKYCSELYLD